MKKDLGNSVITQQIFQNSITEVLSYDASGIEWLLPWNKYAMTNVCNNILTLEFVTS